MLIARRLLGGSEYRLASPGRRESDPSGHLPGSGRRRTWIAALDHLETYTERGGGGVVWDSFWSAWDAFDGADDYRSTIQRAVAYGGDTDTTAAIAGGLAGIRWGIEGIPADGWPACAAERIVTPLIDRLVGRVTDEPDPRRLGGPRSGPGPARCRRPPRDDPPPRQERAGFFQDYDRDLPTDAASLRDLGVTVISSCSWRTTNSSSST